MFTSNDEQSLNRRPWFKWIRSQKSRLSIIDSLLASRHYQDFSLHVEDFIPFTESKDKIFLDTPEGRRSLKALERKFHVDWEEVRVFTLEQTRAEAKFQRSP